MISAQEAQQDHVAGPGHLPPLIAAPAIQRSGRMLPDGFTPEFVEALPPDPQRNGRAADGQPPVPGSGWRRRVAALDDRALRLGRLRPRWRGPKADGGRADRARLPGEDRPGHLMRGLYHTDAGHG